MSTSLGFRAALSGRVMLAVGLTSAALGCGDESGGGAQAGGAVGGGEQGGAEVGGAAAGGDTAAGGAEVGGAAQGGAAAGGAAQGGAPPGQENVERCFTNPNLEPGAPCPTLAEAMGPFSCTDTGELVTAWLSGPVSQDALCCYMVDVTAPGDINCGAVGRPLVVAQRAARAPLRRGDGAWRASHEGPALAGLSAEQRVALAAAWAEEARYEHASVASFSKFALELMAFGAPADLVRRAHQAALDEVRHAELGFGLASAYAGVPIEPGPLSAIVELRLASSMDALVEALIIEGCVGETVAAWIASAQHEAAEDAAVRSALAVIAEDEARHAELAWRSLRWALNGADAGRRALAAGAFERAIAATRGAELPDAMAVPSHGRLGRAELVRERERALSELVEPSARALLG